MPDKQSECHVLNPHESAWAVYARRLKRLRTAAGHSQAEVGRACIVSGKLISAIETLRRLPGEDVSQRLDKFYEVDFFEEQCHQISREMHLPARFDQYILQEEQAAIIHSYDPSNIPGLLQTEAYARHIIGRMHKGEELEKAVETRMRRQEKLRGDAPPLLVALVREAALREMVGGARVMGPQLAHLIEMSKMLNVCIEVVPNGLGIAVSSGYALLDYFEGSPVGWTEAGFGYGHLVPDPRTLHRMRVTFDLTRSDAYSVGKTEQTIRALLEAL
ncbi:helix-turn-helix transcriptional regulator [Spirillospora sp. NPDC049652]